MTNRLAEMLSDALETHGIPCRQESNRVLVEGAALTFQTFSERHTTYPDSVLMMITFGTEARSLDGRTVWNQFAGVGKDEEAATADGFAKFLLGPFHVLLDALGGHLCDEGGEEWRTMVSESGIEWRICDSPLVTQGIENPASVPIGSVQEEMLNLFVRDASPIVHWAEVFFASLNGQRTELDIQLDGEPWSAGVQVFSQWAYAPENGYVSGRYFFVALPSTLSTD